jgi:hypothetical protein
MKRLNTFTFLATLGIALASCSEQKDTLNQEKEFIAISDENLVHQKDIELLNGRIVFKSAESFVQVLNKNFDSDYATAFKRVINKKGVYVPISFEDKVERVSKNSLNLFFLNADGIFQLKNKVYKVDFIKQEYRLLDIENIDELPHLISGRISPRITVYSFAETNTPENIALATNSNIGVTSSNRDDRDDRIDVAACTICGLGVIAFVAGGIPGGLLEAIACAICLQ